MDSLRCFNFCSLLSAVKESRVRLDAWKTLVASVARACTEVIQYDWKMPDNHFFWQCAAKPSEAVPLSAVTCLLERSFTFRFFVAIPDIVPREETFLGNVHRKDTLTLMRYVQLACFVASFCVYRFMYHRMRFSWQAAISLKSSRSFLLAGIGGHVTPVNGDPMMCHASTYPHWLAEVRTKMEDFLFSHSGIFFRLNMGIELSRYVFEKKVFIVIPK